jgi:hypothetical protein
MTVGRIDVLCEGVSGVEIVKVGFDNMSPSELFRLSGLVHTTGEVGNIPLNELMRQAFFFSRFDRYSMAPNISICIYFWTSR